MVDLGGSLAVASKGLYATGVSTDLNGELRATLIFQREAC
jgi:acyl-coenzyme A thioesterase 13